MNVGIDYRPALWSRTGISRYVRELVGAYARFLDAEDDTQLRLYGDCLRRARRDPLDPVRRDSAYVQLHARRIPARWSLRRARRSGRGIEARLGPLDLFHTTDYVALPLGEVPHVATIYDLTFWIDDAFYGAERADRLRAVTQDLVRDARAVLAPSHFTAAEIVLRLGVHPDRVFVTELGADHVRRGDPPCAPAPGTPPFLLTLGTLEPRKNHLRCLRAFEALCREGAPHHWRVIGRPGWLHEPFLEALASSPVRHRVHVAARCTEVDVRDALAHAELLLYPSLAEGYGLPVVEAMALGTPVLTAAVTATAEVAGDAALLVPPDDEDAITRGLLTLVRDPSLRETLATRGLERTRDLTWKRTAARTLSVYHHMLAARPRDSLSRLF
ncbi:MAG: glycosyltransferase family 4 protein [Planctomycetes bacterium]|nr:glycosyltransferase family 4 protein [Planctomycetota bacterium]